MTIAITGLRASPWQSLASYIKQLERSCRRWQLYNCSNFLTRVTTLSTCTQGVDTGVESESPPSYIFDSNTDKASGMRYLLII